MNPPPEQQGMMEAMEVLAEEGPDCKIVYWKFKMPMMSSRDNVMRIQIVNHEGGRFVICETIEHHSKPVFPGVVRMFVYTRGFIRPGKEAGTHEYTEFTVMNMGGYIPARLLNMVIASETQKEFANMVKFVREKNK